MKAYCYADPVTTRIVVMSDKSFILKSIEEIKDPGGEIFLALNPKKKLTEAVNSFERIAPIKYSYSLDIDLDNLIVIPIEIIDNVLYLL